VSPVPAARGLFAFALVAAVCVLVGALGTPVAWAGAPGQLRVAHLSPDTPAIDVAIAPLTGSGPVTDPGRDLASALRYGDVGTFTEFPPGRYAVSLRKAGSGPTSPPALSEQIVVPPGGAVTVALTGLFADAGLQTLPEDLSPPPPGSARVRVLAAAAGAHAVDLSRADGPVLASGLLLGGAGDPVTVPAGPAVLRMDDGRGSVDVPADLAPGSVATLLVLDRPDGGLTLRVVVDAAGPAVVPTGGVEAGGGPSAPWAGWPVAALALSLAAVRNRRRLVVLTTGVVVAGLVQVPVGAVRAAADIPPPVVLAAEPADAPPGPTRVRVPAAGIDAPLEGVGLDATGALAVPQDGTTAGWYAQGTVPGASGPAVLAGHVDGGGAPAVFASLADLRPGDAVLVDRADGTTVTFVVTGVGRYPKSDFPTAAVYGPTTAPELRLITCGGAFDRAARSYLDNVVVYATRS
jgi:hypothetical protein